MTNAEARAAQNRRIRLSESSPDMLSLLKQIADDAGHRPSFEKFALYAVRARNLITYVETHEETTA